MKKTFKTTTYCNICFIFLIAFVITVISHKVGHTQNYKLVIGMPFVYFDLEDIYNQRWISSYLRGKPIIILTGHRNIRYEILKWAEALKAEFGLPGSVHLLWVVNTSKIPWSTSRATIVNQWRQFAPPIPLLLDWHAVIGKALRINYNAPNIIGIDADGRFAFHEIHTYSPEVYAAISQKIKALIAASPYPQQIPKLPSALDTISNLPKGKKGLSE